MANFDPTQAYSWEAAHFTETFGGPTTDAELNASTVFNTSGFQNTFTGTFGWHLDAGSGTLYLTYTGRVTFALEGSRGRRLPRQPISTPERNTDDGDRFQPRALPWAVLPEPFGLKSCRSAL